MLHCAKFCRLMRKKPTFSIIDDDRWTSALDGFRDICILISCFSILKYSSQTINVSLDVISHISTCLFCVFRWWSLPGTTINSMLGARTNFDPSLGMDTLGICLVSEVIIFHAICEFYCFLQFAVGRLLRKPKAFLSHLTGLNMIVVQTDVSFDWYWEIAGLGFVCCYCSSWLLYSIVRSITLFIRNQSAFNAESVLLDICLVRDMQL